MDTSEQDRDAPHIVISVVSHGHGRGLGGLLESLRDARHPLLSVVLTANVDEDLSFAPPLLGGRLRIRRNAAPRGFGANHNAVWAEAAADVFCVCNPDVRVEPDVFGPLLAALEDPGVGVAAPRVLSPAGELEDSVRRDLTPGRVLARVWRGPRAHEYDLAGAPPLRPDWVAGMFMAFRWEAFGAVGGFDERFYLYCEDADICRRLRRAGRRVVYVPAATITHDARRASRRSLVHLSRHVTSLARYWLVPAAPPRGGRLPAPAARPGAARRGR
ncbi:MAG: glycosyltransferase [Planctomycetota bacterium]